MRFNITDETFKLLAKSYMVIALDDIEHSPNKITKQELYDEMEAVMNIYTPKDAIITASKYVNDDYRVN